MVWRETGIMDERLRFIASLLEDDETMTDLCVSFGISRKTGYKFERRYEEHGPKGCMTFRAGRDG